MSGPVTIPVTLFTSSTLFLDKRGAVSKEPCQRQRKSIRCQENPPLRLKRGKCDMSHKLSTLHLHWTVTSTPRELLEEPASRTPHPGIHWITPKKNLSSRTTPRSLGSTAFCCVRPLVLLFFSLLSLLKKNKSRFSMIAP